MKKFFVVSFVVGCILFSVVFDKGGKCAETQIQSSEIQGVCDETQGECDEVQDDVIADDNSLELKFKKSAIGSNCCDQFGNALCQMAQSVNVGTPCTCYDQYGYALASGTVCNPSSVAPSPNGGSGGDSGCFIQTISHK